MTNAYPNWLESEAWITTSPARMRREVRHDVGTLGEVGPKVANGPVDGSFSYEHRPILQLRLTLYIHLNG